MTTGSDHVERAALDDLHEAATPSIAKALRLERRSSGATLISIAAALPPSAIVINRALGLGLDRPASRDDVEAMVAAYRDAGVERYFVQRHPAARPDSLVDWLAEAGLEKTRGWQKFARGTDSVPDVATDLRVEEVGAEHGPAFGRIVCDAFDLGEAAVPWLARLPGRDGWHVFMSFAGDEPAGAGALFVRDGVGWTDFGATAPVFRRRGSQGAVLAARIRRGLDSGCTEIHTCTGEDVPGDPQHSYRNIRKLDFAETYVRENYALPKG